MRVRAFAFRNASASASDLADAVIVLCIENDPVKAVRSLDRS
jgi:hypothetical protein